MKINYGIGKHNTIAINVLYIDRVEDNMTYMATLYHKNTCHRAMKFTILVDPSLVIITIYLVCLIYAWE